ncbi:atp-binding protein : Putative ATP/GTP binding protein OS=Parvularcula bermudensis (strain ATCC BAA-594 / HTCC2503 / KCTC 12087) GN=PB2503_12209 PE=4 SV=1: AAA_5 [Gemmataceae bacterium]|nr:atp-binding protein : Putative ATP/GTP binding protein OS=Parvularcula bermudensis (strain ATCC BAA-594 / HTCC2503 / KCTC 12087) GN=PB2503_12209 PE=4 SV=1: AAA_5 [Gemmataceae bacterium]VTT99265.1 atp-binding protein : Putative ATP/GTP binding protein OS=Parvularcula bermudensis (strain ATCC BAA-594 / HTCC2503 / KCTC 12087) GN=PB2503_12209 PE=4 SV=1: AAA_5 [Gemmataceae bacterium]
MANPQPSAVTLAEAKELLRCLADAESVLLLSPPGVGKSAAVEQAARDAGLVVRSLLGTQIAPEDVSGVPKVVGGRAVFCPPRLLLPDDGKPFCLFLDELPAAPPDVQKAFYSLLLERRIGEYRLPIGTWVVAAGNRTDDRAIVRALSSALVNRVFVVPVRVDAAEWFAWAEASGVRADVRGFVKFVPSALQRAVPADPVPFSTPRSWALLSRDLDLAEARGALSAEERRALAFGRVTAHDAALFCALCEEGLGDLRPVLEYVEDPTRLPKTETAMWFLVSRTRSAVAGGELIGTPPEKINAFLTAAGEEYRFALVLDLVEPWAELGASDLMLRALRTVTGLPESLRPGAS